MIKTISKELASSLWKIVLLVILYVVAHLATPNAKFAGVALTTLVNLVDAVSNAL